MPVELCAGCEHRRGAVCAVDGLAIEGRGGCLVGLWPGESRATFVPLTPGPSPRRTGARGASITPATLTTDNRQLTTAVVVISHNYGRFLGEAIRSVLGQSRPAAEVIVVDDASEDETREVAESFHGVKYIRGEWRDVNQAREAGFKATSADVICFLDADDKLSGDYLELGLPWFVDPLVALVYSDWEYIGNRVGVERFPEPGTMSIHWRNFAHAASLVRRSALVATDAFRGLPDMTRCRHHCDWALWRRVLTGTRRAAKQAGRLLYRQHGKNWLLAAMADRGTYYDRAALWQEPVTIFVPLSGRLDATEDLLAWLDRQTAREQCRLVLFDASEHAGFHRRVRRWAAECEYHDVRVLSRWVSEPGTAGGDATKPGPRRAIVEAMWRIYDGLAELETEYILTVEDDVIPPDDALERLLGAMDHDVFSVASPYRGRYGGWMAADVPPGAAWRLLLTPKTGVQATTFNGFGCTLLRRSVLQEWTPGPYAGTPDFDMALYLRLRDEGRWRSLIDWDCRSIHAGLLPA